MSALLDRWRAMAPRERRALALGGLALAAILAWLAIWEPLVESRELWRTRVASAETDLAWMRAAAARLQASGPVAAAVPDDGRSLLARVDASAREAGLGSALLRVEPIATGQVRVTFEQAGFDALMAWLEALSQAHGVRVTELSAQRADGVGLVDARVSLESPSP
jgi:general secretion pathway protein M